VTDLDKYLAEVEAAREGLRAGDFEAV
jgi:hypothetical protein